MTPDELDRRLADLEMRVAFQEQALLELSDALAAARDEEGRTALLLHRALEELKAIAVLCPQPRRPAMLRWNRLLRITDPAPQTQQQYRQ